MKEPHIEHWPSFISFVPQISQKVPGVNNIRMYLTKQDMTTYKSVAYCTKMIMTEQSSDGISVRIYHANQCDPKKCTGIRLGRLRKAEIIKVMRRIPRTAIVLNPVSETAISKSDVNNIMKRGIVALDCSWKQAEDIFRNSRYGVQRALPYLLAANPINTYNPGSTDMEKQRKQVYGFMACPNCSQRMSFLGEKAECGVCHLALTVPVRGQKPIQELLKQWRASGETNDPDIHG